MHTKTPPTSIRTSHVPRRLVIIVLPVLIVAVVGTSWYISGSQVRSEHRLLSTTADALRLSNSYRVWEKAPCYSDPTASTQPACFPLQLDITVNDLSMGSVTSKLVSDGWNQTNKNSSATLFWKEHASDALCAEVENRQQSIFLRLAANPSGNSCTIMAGYQETPAGQPL